MTSPSSPSSMSADSEDPGLDGSDTEVRAAGGVVWRVVDGSIRVALIHRPRYEDWTFPKGKVEAGEADEETAHREVLEETGLDCVLGRELRSVTYLDTRGRRKRVRYWEMTVGAGDFAPNEEVDRLVWATMTEARGRLTYRHDLNVLESFRRLTSR